MTHVEGIEAMAAVLEWIAQQMRAGIVTGVSLEISQGDPKHGRLSVRFATAKDATEFSEQHADAKMPDGQD